MSLKAQDVLQRTIERCRERDIIIPTYSEMADPSLIPEGIRRELADIGLWDLHPRNLFRITWKNQPVETGGGFGGVNYLEFPSELTGVPARILMLLGKYFPTGSHKVGATFGPLVERLVRGEFDPTRQRALWPSTGNYCRGGAYDAFLLACPSIAVLPEGMSKERFDWLKKVGSEIHATPGSESNVKEVYDKSFALQRERPDEVVILNQFAEFGNSVWHYVNTGQAMEEVFSEAASPGQRLTGLFLTQGSAGTLAAGDYLRERFPRIKVCAGEAWPCPTLLFNGYGEHRIEGIGDKHVPWIHNLKNMDLVAGIDDEPCLRLLRLFNETEGRKFMVSQGVPEDCVSKLDLLGISGVANLIGSIKAARYFEWSDRDIILTVATDSMELYASRLRELREERGEYTEMQAGRDYDSCLMGATTDHMQELGYWEKKRMHNLKYFTWVEQLGKDCDELDRQWYDDEYWTARYRSHEELDAQIRNFNKRTGLLEHYA
jgi:cysteine synthase A